MEIKINSKKHGQKNVIINEEDYEKIGKKKLYISANCKYRKKLYYVYFYKDGKRYSLHRYLLGAKTGDVVDHINSNPLDNRIENLRICTAKQNVYSRPSVSGVLYKGVEKRTRRKRPYRARIRKDGITYYLGSYFTPYEAALAYNKKAKELFGDFAYLNEV